MKYFDDLTPEQQKKAIETECFTTIREANKYILRKKLPANVSAVYIEDVKRWVLLVNCSRAVLPTLKG